MQRFGQIVDYFRTDLIFKKSSLSPKWSVFLKAANALVTNRITVLQLWGYKMLLVLTPGLVKIDGEAVNSSAPHKNGLIFEQFKKTLLNFQDIVNSMLGDFKLVVCCFYFRMEVICCNVSELAKTAVCLKHHTIPSPTHLLIYYCGMWL